MKTQIFILLNVLFLFSCNPKEVQEDKNQAEDTIRTQETEKENNIEPEEDERKVKREKERLKFDSIYQVLPKLDFAEIKSKFKYKDLQSFSITYDTHKTLELIDSLTYTKLQLHKVKDIPLGFFENENNAECHFCNYFYGIQTQTDDKSFYSIIILSKGFEYAHNLVWINYDKTTNKMIDYAQIAGYREDVSIDTENAVMIDSKEIKSLYSSNFNGKVVFSAETKIKVKDNGKFEQEVIEEREINAK